METSYWWFIGAAVVAIVLCVVLYHQWVQRRVAQAREQQRLTLTQNISHELKTPVASIRGALETILMHPEMPDEQKTQFLERAYQQSGRLSNLVEDISTINKLDTQAELYNRLELELYSVVKNVVEDVSIKAEQQGVTITYNVPTHLIISGNYTLLYSIFRNIIDNSMTYAGKGSHISIDCTNQDLEHIYFSVKDDGPGVPPECLPHLFERFYRVDKGRSRKMGGTGLGLAIVKNSVLLHGGTIRAANLPEGGLKFEFTIKK